MKTFTALLGPLVALTIGLAVAYIALQQWQVARAKLRLDLFDRRYRVFEAARGFLASLIRGEKFDDGQLLKFFADTADAKFLFNTEVQEFLSQITKTALDMRAHQKIYEALPVGERRAFHVDAEKKQFLWLGEQLTTMTKTFEPYLSFSHIK